MKSCHVKGCQKTGCWITPRGELVCVQHGKTVKGKRRPYHLTIDELEELQRKAK